VDGGRARHRMGSLRLVAEQLCELAGSLDVEGRAYDRRLPALGSAKQPSGSDSLTSGRSCRRPPSAVSSGLRMGPRSAAVH